jgi:hypothetical protein
MKIDLGCGPVKREGFLGIDNNPKCNPDVCMDMQSYVSELEENTIEEAIAAGSLGFLTGREIYYLINHLHRAIEPKGTFTIIVNPVENKAGNINPSAWTVPLLRTHFSLETFKCFQGGSTLELRGVEPWKIIDRQWVTDIVLKVVLEPVK